jgi:hypothetical protein
MTEGVGLCKAGIQTCLPDGSGFGECKGAVTPEAELCGTPTDDDCDGTANETDAGCACTPGEIEACYTGPAPTRGVGLCKSGLRACDASGTVWRPCEGEVTPQQEICSDATDDDCDGIACSAPLWAALFGDANVQAATALGVDASGNIAIGGTFSGSIDLGSGPLLSTGSADVFVASFDPAGTFRWSARFGGAGPDTLQTLATTPAGDVILGGTFSGSVSFGTTTLNRVAGIDSFVARLDPSGTPQWAQQIGETGDQTLRGVAVDAMNNVVVAGYFGGVLLCSPPPVPVCVTSAGGTDIFVRKYDPMGAILWTKVFGDAANQSAFGVAVDPDGNVLVTGKYNGTLDIGTHQATNSGSGLSNLFIAKLDSDGDDLWLRDYGDAGAQEGSAIVTSAQGAVLVAGTYAGTMSLGPAGALSSSDPQTAFALSLDSDGTPVWARSFGEAGAQRGLAISADTAGNVVLTGSAQGPVDLGGGQLPSGGGLDALVVKLDPEGRYLWGKLLGAAGEQKATAVAVSPIDGAVWVAGSADGTIDFGLGELEARGTDAFAVEFSP